MVIKQDAKEILYIAGFLVGLGVTWGTLSSKVNAQGKALEPVPGLVVRQAVVDAKLDYLIGLVEFKYGMRSRRPSRLEPRDQP